METRWARWTKHLMECHQCMHVLSTFGNLQNAAVDHMCTFGQWLYGSYRATTVRLEVDR